MANDLWSFVLMENQCWSADDTYVHNCISLERPKTDAHPFFYYGCKNWFKSKKESKKKKYNSAANSNNSAVNQKKITFFFFLSKI